jgi:hypothetical protein
MQAGTTPGAEKSTKNCLAIRFRNGVGRKV